MAVIVLSPMALSSIGRAGEASREGFQQTYKVPQDPQPLVRQILSRPEFTRQVGESFIDWLRWQLQEMLRRALQWLFERSRGMKGFRFDPASLSLAVDAMLIGAAVVVALLVVWMLVKHLFGFSFARVAPRLDMEKRDHVIDSGRSRALALALANQGDYRGALIHLFRFVLLLLDETGKLTIRPGQTNREILAGIGSNAPVYALLAEMIPVFDSVRYGDSPCDRDDYEKFALLSEKVVERDGAP